MEHRLIKTFLILAVCSFLLLGGCFEENESSERSHIESSFSEEISKNVSEPDGFSENGDISETAEGSDIGISEEMSNDNSAEHSEIVIQMPKDDEFVLIADYIPTIKTDIRYATVNNFTGEVIYESEAAYLRYGTVKKLASVQAELNSMGYSLLIWDAYRPPEAQWKLWEICPDANFVSDPNVKYSSHSRGNTVDITIVSPDGEELEMPSGFDEFGTTADRDYSDVSETAAKNSEMLEELMEKNGFKGYSKEWWHYADTNEYPVFGEENND